jgi:hypothetical protein
MSRSIARFTSAYRRDASGFKPVRLSCWPQRHETLFAGGASRCALVVSTAARAFDPPDVDGSGGNRLAAEVVLYIRLARTFVEPANALRGTRCRPVFSRRRLALV